jgi:electron transfer flavoprotein beta subunit
MKIALCVKQVPDTTDIRWTEHNTIQREGVESVINPCDRYALEMALKIKQTNLNSSITVFTMGPSQASEILRYTLALGCDEAVLISDKKFSGADTLATGKTISSAIKKVLPEFDLIICGQFAADGDTAQTGPNIASFLDIPQVTYAKDYIENDEKSLVLKQVLEDKNQVVKVQTPALICVTEQGFEPSRPKINGIINASKKEIKILTLSDIGLNPEDVGIKGSPTYVSKAFRKISSHNAQKYTLKVEESVNLIKSKLSELGVYTNGK